MAINFGGATINRLHLGATEIRRAYLGSSLVFDVTGGGATTPPVVGASLSTGANAGTGDILFNLATSSEGDVVFLLLGSDAAINGVSDGNTNIGHIKAVSQGWTVIAGGDSAVSNPGHLIAWKAMGPTPDTTVEVFVGGNRGVVCTSIAISGANTTAPIDNGVAASYSPSGLPTAPPYATTADDSLRVIVGFLDDTNDTMTPPTGYGDEVTNALDTNAGCSLIAAFKAGGAAGTDTPGPFGGGLSDEGRAVSFAVRAQ